MLYENITPADIFHCQQCGDCCRGYGGTFVTPADIENIARYIHTDVKCFVKDYCQMSGSRPVLAQGTNGYCVFWDKVCTIHPVKPKMCRRWPFIDSVLVDVENWYVMAASCPGIRTDFPAHVVTACVHAEIDHARRESE